MDSIIQRILEFNKDTSPDLLKYKMQVLSESLFRFFRGTNHLFYEDLKKDLPDSPLCWVTGDLHLENFGSYKGDNRLVYFDLNDFDDALLAPANWELVRMLTSIFVAFDSLEIRQKKAFNMAKLFLNTYSSTLAGGKPDYIEPRTAKGIVAKFLMMVEKRKIKDVLSQKTIIKKGRIQFNTDNEKHYKLDKELKAELINHMNGWLKNDTYSPYNYKIKDAIFRRAGTGSIGVNRYALLLKSSNNTGEKYLVVEMKQARPPSLQKYLPTPQPRWNSDAERIVNIQRRMENKPPALLSTTIFKNDSYVIEEMQPTQDSINFNLIKEDYRDIYQVINDMAILTASAQLRSSGRSGSAIADELISFGQNNQWIDNLLRSAIDNAQQTKSNFLTYLNDYRPSGRKKNKIVAALPGSNSYSLYTT